MSDVTITDLPLFDQLLHGIGQTAQAQVWLERSVAIVFQTLVVPGAATSRHPPMTCCSDWHESLPTPAMRPARLRQRRSWSDSKRPASQLALRPVDDPLVVTPPVEPCAQRSCPALSL